MTTAKKAYAKRNTKYWDAIAKGMSPKQASKIAPPKRAAKPSAPPRHIQHIAYAPKCHEPNCTSEGTILVCQVWNQITRFYCLPHLKSWTTTLKDA